MLQDFIGAISLGLIWAVMAIAIYITYKILDIADMTVEGSITMGAAISAVCISNGMNPYLALLLAFGGGLLAGLVTGFFHTILKIPALLSGILTMLALYSVNLRIMGKANISLLKMDTVFTPFENLGLSKNLAVIAVMVVIVGVIICALYWFFGTELGCAIRATGNNHRMARAQGINTRFMTIVALMLSNGLVGLAGALIAQNQNFADMSMGIGSIVIALASLIIGEVLFGKRNFFLRLLSLVFGAVVYRIIIAFVLWLGMPSNDLRLFTALTVALALALPVFRSYFQTLRRSLRKGE